MSKEDSYILSSKVPCTEKGVEVSEASSEPQTKTQYFLKKAQEPKQITKGSSVASSTQQGALLVERGISANLFQKLKAKGYSQKALNSIGRCGDKTGQKFTYTCGGCAERIIEGTWWCDKIFCKRCSLKRTRRIIRKYSPMLNSLSFEKKKREFLHLIISPANVNSPDDLFDLKDKLKRLMNCKEMQIKVLGFMVSTECTKKIQRKFHIHFHLLIYGARLDNKVEGYCRDCKKDKIKFNRKLEKFHCVNRKCWSFNVVKTKDSPLVQLCKKFFKSEVYAFITDKFKVDGKYIKINDNPTKVLEYILKYITKSDKSFQSDDDLADYLIATYKKKIISTGRLFYNYKVPEDPVLCFTCKTPLIRKS